MRSKNIFQRNQNYGIFPCVFFSLWDFVLLGYFPTWDFFQMGFCPLGFCPLGFCPHGIFSSGIFSSWDFFLHGILSSWDFFLEPVVIPRTPVLLPNYHQINPPLEVPLPKPKPPNIQMYPLPPRCHRYHHQSCLLKSVSSHQLTLALSRKSRRLASATCWRHVECARVLWPLPIRVRDWEALRAWMAQLAVRRVGCQWGIVIRQRSPYFREFRWSPSFTTVPLWLWSSWSCG